MTKPIGSDQDFATFMTTTGWQMPGHQPHHFNATTITYNIGGLTPERQAVAEAAFRAWDGAVRLALVRQDSLPSMITIDDDAGQSAAFSTYTMSGSYTGSASIKIGAAYGGGSNAFDDYVMQTFVHEIGHALGLYHSGPYNASATWGVDNIWDNDTYKMTIMSYFDDTHVGLPLTYYQAPRSADILGVEQMYDHLFTPDLIVSSVGNQGYVMEDQQNHVLFTVANVGLSASSAGMASIRLDGVQVGTVAVPAIAAGQSYSGRFDWSFSAAANRTWTVLADATNTTIEASEGNNGSAASSVVITPHKGSYGSPWMFDSDFYYWQNPDVLAAGMDAQFHFNVVGWTEGRDPNPYFDTSYYLSRYPDIAAANVNPLHHYSVAGWSEGRDPHPLFDTSSYLTANADVAAVHMNPLLHFLGWGSYEGRDNYMV